MMKRFGDFIFAHSTNPTLKARPNKFRPGFEKCPDVITEVFDNFRLWPLRNAAKKLSVFFCKFAFFGKGQCDCLKRIGTTGARIKKAPAQSKHLLQLFVSEPRSALRKFPQRPSKTALKPCTQARLQFFRSFRKSRFNFADPL